MNKSLSIYLDLARFLAAATVFIVHANYDRITGGLPVVSLLKDFGNDAVMVFFVLSGFVIAYVSDKKEKTLREYFSSRFARLYSVTAPALILTVVVDYLGSHINYAIYNGWWLQTDNPAWRFIANFFFVNELWYLSVRPFSNGPFWSLGYEFWYYVIFAAAWYLKHPSRYLLIAAICLLIGPKILILFPIWLLGVAVYFKIKHRPVGEPIGWFMFIGSLAAYAAFRKLGYPHLLHEWLVSSLGPTIVYEKLNWSQYFLSSYITGILVAVHFIGVASIAPRLAKILAFFEKPVRYLAGYTFAIYLFHYPLLHFFAAVSSKIAQPPLRSTIVVCGTIMAIWAMGTITERRKADVKRWILSRYDAIVGSVRLAKKGI